MQNNVPFRNAMLKNADLSQHFYFLSSSLCFWYSLANDQWAALIARCLNNRFLLT